MKGFKLKDGSIWTIISYDTKEGCEEKTESQISLEDITNFTGVEWDKISMKHTPVKLILVIVFTNISKLMMKGFLKQFQTFLILLIIQIFERRIRVVQLNTVACASVVNKVKNELLEKNLCKGLTNAQIKRMLTSFVNIV